MTVWQRGTELYWYVVSLAQHGRETPSGTEELRIVWLIDGLIDERYIVRAARVAYRRRRSVVVDLLLLLLEVARYLVVVVVSSKGTDQQVARYLVLAVFLLVKFGERKFLIGGKSVVDKVSLSRVETSLFEET